MIYGGERHKAINADQFLGSEAVPLMIRLFRCGGAVSTGRPCGLGRLHRGAQARRRADQ